MNTRMIVTFLLSGAACLGLQAQEKTLAADSIVTTDSRLDSLLHALPEVLVTGERPVVKAEQGKLVYDLPRLIQDRPVDNVYDAVKELPGILEMNGALQLGGQPVRVVLDGKVTTLSPSQLTALLQSIPASRIEKAEVMYNAPARYQVRGALVNIVLKRTSGGQKNLQGELYGRYRQKYYENFTERASLLYGCNRLSVDLLYSHDYGHSYFTTGKEAIHTLADGTVHPVTTDEARRTRGNTHNFRVGADYDFSKEHGLSFVYTGKLEEGRSRMQVAGTQQSMTHSNSTEQLHNGRLDYRLPFGMKAGAELTYYRSPSDQTLHSRMEGTALDFYSEECQRINRWKLFLAQEHALKQGWGVNYGVIYTSSTDNSFQRYYDSKEAGEEKGTATGEGSEEDAAGTLPADMVSRRREQTLNFYAGFSKAFGKKLSLDASLAVEHYKTPVWNQWDWYPSLNLNYMPAAGHILQLSLSSDKSYPAYWAVQDAVSYLGGAYSEIQGNPLLKPAREYQLHLGYIFKGKYLLNAWFSHTDDYSTQTLYQSSERLVEIYKHLNFDYQQQAGVQLSAPFAVKSWLNSRLTLTGLWQHEKDGDFWDLPFERRRFYFIAHLNNTFTLSTRPDLKLTLTGFVHSRALQGIYDLPASGYVNLSLRYAFARQRALLTLYGNDLLETGQISPRIRFRTQHVTNHYSCFRELGVSFAYKFGGYKEKKRDEVDTSRFR